MEPSEQVIGAMVSTVEYFRWHNHYYGNSDYIPETRKYFQQNAKQLNLHKAKTLLSIGAGDGQIDSYIVKNLSPELKNYIGVEPWEPSFKTLTAAMSTESRSKVKLVNKDLSGWSGPDEPVDIVLLCHVLYNIPDQASVLRQCYEWLKPDGSIVIVQAYADTIFNQIVKEHAECPKTMYDYDSLKKDVESEGFQFVEGSKFVNQMPSHFEDDSLVRLNFQLFAGDYPDEQMTALVKNFRENWESKCADSGHTITSGCMQIKKPFS